MNKGTTFIVLGTLFGDEGKGVTTDYLCLQNPNALVVRFNGGHQAGHTVVSGKKRHIFSSFGSGSLRGNPSYTSKYCTVHPRGLINELRGLYGLGCNPKLILDEEAMITTPYDVAYNRFLESMNNHGSCGIGFGTTIERNLGSEQLFAGDLRNPLLLAEKLEEIKSYYFKKFLQYGDQHLDSEYHPNNLSLDDFNEAVSDLLDDVNIDSEELIFQKYKSVIFEGAQGILLDMDHGFFPHVTRSNTTSRNALDIIYRNRLAPPEIYYVTRCYQTRHGNGPMTNSEHAHLLHLSNNEKETNVSHRWQGNFRTTPFDLDLFTKAIQSDQIYSSGYKLNLVITCLDQLEDGLPYTQGGILGYASKEDFVQILSTSQNFQAVFVGDSPSPDLWRKTPWRIKTH